MPSYFGGNLHRCPWIFRARREFWRLRYGAGLPARQRSSNGEPAGRRGSARSGWRAHRHLPLFDTGEYRVSTIKLCPYFEVHGGVRERIFQAVQAAYHPATISKVPLVRWRKGMQFHYGTHSLTHVATSKGSGALLHFKFLSDFHGRVETEVARGEHYATANTAPTAT
jgi:hypothetical protein